LKDATLHASQGNQVDLAREPFMSTESSELPEVEASTRASGLKEDDLGQDLCNAWVLLQNAVFRYLCLLSGQHGEIWELDVRKLAQWVVAHPGENLGKLVRDTVELALSDCGVD
jgi:hypothetical protein